MPLQGNRVLQRYYAERKVRRCRWAGKPSRTLNSVKCGRACMLEQAGKTYINAGETRYINTNIDTSGLGGGFGNLLASTATATPLGKQPLSMTR